MNGVQRQNVEAGLLAVAVLVWVVPASVLIHCALVAAGWPY